MDYDSGISLGHFLLLLMHFDPYLLHDMPIRQVMPIFHAKVKDNFKGSDHVLKNYLGMQTAEEGGCDFYVKHERKTLRAAY